MSLPTLDKAGYDYRPLKQGDRGWDVYALQTCLHELVYWLDRDGILGPLTRAAVMDFQDQEGLKMDGIAGIVTQRQLTLRLIWPLQRQHRTPSGLARGQAEKEFGFQLGNHSVEYEDGTIDVGVQRNVHYGDEAAYAIWFDIPRGLGDGEEDGPAPHAGMVKNLRLRHDEYKGYGKVADDHRLWELAAGAWFAPGWASQVARGRDPGADARTDLEAYIDRVTVYYP